MKEEFLRKIENGEYISNALYRRILESDDWEVIPKGFDLDEYNEHVLNKLYARYKPYFEKMYDGVDDRIKLDEEQSKAILADEDYALIIAGAGTGKTTTMTSKVKFLVDVKKVDPEKILVMSYTRKATEELRRRIVVDFGIPAHVTTFHSLGLMYIREIFGDRKCYVVDTNRRNQIFMDYFETKVFPYKQKIEEMIEVFTPKLLGGEWVFGNYFKENYAKYDNFREYFQAYKEYKKLQVGDIGAEVRRKIDKMLNNDVVYTLKGELVKSRGEAVIANFLFCNNIEYKYEELYEEVMDDNRTYKPDFTIDVGGEKVYIEYFGMSGYEVGQATRYNKIRQMKEDYHKRHRTKFIALDYRPGQKITESLREKLEALGVELRPKSLEEIYEVILDGNMASQFFRFRGFLYKCVDAIKMSTRREYYKEFVDDYLEKMVELPGSSLEENSKARKQFEYIDEFYEYYQGKIAGVVEQGFDYSDLIYYANKYISSLRDDDERLKFDYIIIDEYQDISQERYELAKRVAERGGAKVIAVGDDWQSIYAFNGSRIEYIYDFEKYFLGAKKLKISRTYRNSQELIDVSGEFVMRNPEQMRKHLISGKKILDPVKFVGYDQGGEYETLKKVILKIHQENPTHKILILARLNSTIERCYEDPELKDGIGSRIMFVGHDDIKIEEMTIHASKGLTSDEVIVMGLDTRFPSMGRREYWLVELFRPKGRTEKTPFAEERRIFYVALTRTRNHVYLLANKAKLERSKFVDEIHQIIKEGENEV